MAVLEVTVDREAEARAGMKGKLDDILIKVRAHERSLTILREDQAKQGELLTHIVTKVDNTELWIGHLNGQMNKLENDLTGRMDSLENKVTGLGGRMDGVETRLDGVETRLDGVEGRLDGVETRLSGVETKLGGVETTLADVKDGVGQILERLAEG